MLINNNPILQALQLLQETVYQPCGFMLNDIVHHTESTEYGACAFSLNDKKIYYRVAKITPTKVGQFVTIWQRNINGITEPFHVADNFDFLIITCKHADNFGQFIFPKSVLADKGIITTASKDGKRGIRVYPPWDATTSKQAQTTQAWQMQYFLTLQNDTTTDLMLTKNY
jgi:hypothetical protein